MSQEDRSEALIEVLEELEQSAIGFVLVGGYAISQFEPRFSTDLNLVIAPDDYGKSRCVSSRARFRTPG